MPNLKRGRRYEDMARQADLYRSDGPREKPHRFQRAYHRNFEGFAEIEELNEQGKPVIRRVYTGKYYEPALEPYRRVSLRILYVLAYLGGAALFLFCATRSAVCNTTAYAALFQGASVLMMLWCAFTLAFYIPGTGKLTIGEYRSQHKSLVSASRACAISLWASAAAALICLLLHLDQDLLPNLLCTAGFTGSGLLLAVIWFFEGRLKYLVTDSQTPAPEDSFEIE